MSPLIWAACRVLALVGIVALASGPAQAEFLYESVAETGTVLEGMTKKAEQFGLGWTSQKVAIFEVQDEFGMDGFLAMKAGKKNVYIPWAVGPLVGKATLWGDNAAIFAGNAAGTPTIYATEDIFAVPPTPLVEVGSQPIAGGPAITALSDEFDLFDKKLLFSASFAGGQAIYMTGDLSLNQVASIVDTNQDLPLFNGPALSVGKATTDGTSILFYASDATNEGYFVTDMTGSRIEPVATTLTENPSEPGSFFTGFAHAQLRGKKAVIHGFGALSEGVYWARMGEVIPKIELELAFDTNDLLPEDDGALFKKFESFSTDGQKIMIFAEGSDSSRAVYAYADPLWLLGKKVATEGQDFLGRKLKKASLSHQAIGSAIFSVEWEAGSQSIIQGEALNSVPSLPGIGLFLLLSAALAALALGHRRTHA